MEQHTQQNPQDPHNNLGIPAQKASSPSTALKVTVLIILIVLLVVGILLPIKLVPSAFSSLSSKISSVFIHKEKTILSTDMTEIAVGKPFTLSWTGQHRTDGSYVLTYPCTEGVHFETSVNQPYETIGCDTPFYFTSSANSIDLTPFSETSRYTDVPISLSFLPNNNAHIEKLASSVVTLTNSAVSSIATNATLPATSTTKHIAKKPSVIPTITSTIASSSSAQKISTTTNNTISSSSISSATNKKHFSLTPSNAHGLPDLAVAMLDIGYINPVTNRFISSNSVTSDQKAAVRFEVVNVGDKNSGPWSFTATLPSQTNPTYTSRTEESLAPGSRVVFTLGFDNINLITMNKVTIIVDPSDLITESNKTNNSGTSYIINSQVAAY